MRASSLVLLLAVSVCAVPDCAAFNALCTKNCCPGKIYRQECSATELVCQCITDATAKPDKTAFQAMCSGNGLAIKCNQGYSTVVNEYCGPTAPVPCESKPDTFTTCSAADAGTDVTPPATAPTTSSSSPDKCGSCLPGGSEDGGVPLVNGRCTAFCSTSGYCGTSEIYKEGGVSCADAGACFSEYTVVSGDTLNAIASTHGTTVDAIVALNVGIDPNALNVGQVIKLPCAPSAPADQPSSPSSPTAEGQESPSTRPSPRALVAVGLLGLVSFGVLA